jgi:ATP-dependent Lon protease
VVKTNLPVILLRGAVLLPHSEVRLEINNDIDKKIIELAETIHDNYVLVISPINPLEQEIIINDLPKIGVIGKIKLKMELNNGYTRVVIEGINRVNVYNYANYSEEKFDGKILSALVGNTTQFAITPKDEMALIRKLLKVLYSC